MSATGSREGIMCVFDFTSKRARQGMKTICSLVSYAEKWVQVIPVNSPGVKLQLERKHVVLFVFVVPSWTGNNPPRRLHRKCHVRSQDQLTALFPVTRKSFHDILVLSSPNSGRKLLSVT